MKRADSGSQLAPMSQNDVGNSGMGTDGDGVSQVPQLEI